MSTPTHFVKIGDRVEVSLVGKLWGKGEVVDISISRHGGSLLFPVFLVKSDSGNEVWVPPISVTPAHEGE